MPLVPVKKIDDRGTVYDIEVAMDEQVTEEGTKPVKGSGIYDFVNSSVATNTANFVGTYDSLEALEEHIDYPEPLTNNDYGFVVGTDAAGNTIYSRYKYNSENEEWMFEYNLNNSSFTANQWETINSGLTSTDKQQIATNTNDIATLKVNAKDYAKQAALALPYDSTQTYVTGDLVTLDGYLYRCDPTGTPMIIGNNLFDSVTVKEGPKYVDGKITLDDYSGWANQTQVGWYSGTVAITSGKTYKLTLPFSTYLINGTPIVSVIVSSTSAVNPTVRLQHNAQGEINFTANDNYICISVETANENRVELYETAGNVLWKKVTVDTLLDEKANSADLATVATSGDYNDLLNKPTIPVVTDRLKSIAAAENYDPSKTYTEGEYMTYDGELYKCDPNGSGIPSENLFNPTTAKTGTGYQNNKGYFNTNGTSVGNSNFYITSNIPITAGGNYRFKGYTGGNNANWCAVTYFNAYGSVLGGTIYGVDVGEVTLNITPPSGTTYVRLSVWKSTENTLEFTALGSSTFTKTTITDELNTKQDTLTFDNTPTLNSNNPVKSNGIAVGLNEKYNSADMVPTTWEEWNAMGDEKYTDHKLYFIPGEDDPQPYKIYGFHIDPTESDPDACVSYLEDAIGMTPASMGATEFSYGTWGNAFFMPKPCMVKSDGTVDYYLDPNDYTKKSDGTASDVANASYDGNAMMEWPLIYYKYEAGLTAGEGYFYCSNSQVDSSYHCWCNYDCDGNIIPHFYTAIYNGTGTTKLRSLSGVTLNSSSGCGDTTGQQEVDRATANNTTTGKVEWYTDVFSDRMLINGLLILISKNLNCQASFGNGLVTGSQSAKESYVTGSLNDKGLFWGDITNQNKGVKVFGMENWWGCVYRRTAGCVGLSNGTYAIKQTWSTVDGTTSTGYNSNGTGYINAGTRPGNSGQYIKQCTYGNDCYLPSVTTGASSTTYYCDYWYTNNTALTYLLLGGCSSNSVHAGFSYFNLYDAFANAAWYIGVCLSLKPLAKL